MGTSDIERDRLRRTPPADLTAYERGVLRSLDPEPDNEDRPEPSDPYGRGQARAGAKKHDGISNQPPPPTIRI